MGGIIQVDTIQNNNTSTLITQTNSTTITIGTTGQTISLAGGASSSGFGATYNGAVNWTSTLVTSALTVSAGVGYFVNTSTAAITLTLPASPSVGDTIILTDFYRTWGTNAVTINQNSLNFQGFTSPNPVYNTDGQTVSIVYSGATQGWIPTSDDDVTLETPQTYSVDFLVVAGGAGGAYYYGGGGGAGGYRNSYSTEPSGGGGPSEASLTFNPSTVYTITVGGGGAGTPGTPSSPNTGSSGVNSSISGTGITTITSNGGGGGGGGGSGTNPGASGGSGGGGGGNGSSSSGGAGTANQGFGGGTGGSAASGGGGGAGSAGSGTTYGNGLASSITGSSVTRGVGGKGPGTSPGTANTGNGGTSDGGNGGSGVVILRMLTSKYSGTTTGSPTVTTDGSDTVIVFNSSGSITG